MARNASKGPIPVNSITHDEKRTNIPTADTVDFHDSAAGSYQGLDINASISRPIGQPSA